MLGYPSSRPENRPNETLTQRLNRLRLEHRRRSRNTGNGTSRSLNQALVTPGPSLPDVNLPTGPNVLDNWNDDHTGMAIRPRPAQVLAANAALNPAPPQERVPVHGPPPPRSWVNPSSRTTGTSRSTARKPRTTTTAAKKGSKKAAPCMTVIERLRLEEDEALEKIYGDEYWFRPASDVRWSTWREEALRLVFSYSVGSLDAGRQVLKESSFIPFELQHGDSKVPTLFENVLKFIFAPSKDRHGEQEHTEEALYSLELLQFLPPHIRKRVLRYVAAHRPLTSEQLRIIHLTNKEEALYRDRADLVDPYEITELVLSGRKVEAGLLGELLTTHKTPEIAASTEKPPSVMIPLQSIILFQTPFLQKRQLLSFPKTITTLGLIALPPPNELWTHKILAVSTEAPVIAGCSCPWCANAEAERASRTTPGQNRCSASPSLPTLPRPALPHTSSALIPQLVALPELLPSLVVLDVSYNPWMSSDTVIRNSNQKEINKSRKGKKTEYVGQGILGTWDLRLWGRIKVLGIKGCFEHLSMHDSVGIIHTEQPLRAGFDPLVEDAGTDLLTSTPPRACGVPRDGHSQWRRREALLEKWEKTVYAVGRTVEVMWREHGCRCRVSE